MLKRFILLVQIFKTKWLIYPALVFCLFLSPTIDVYSNDTILIRRHFLIYYDISGSFKDGEPKNPPLIRDALISLFNNKIPVNTKGSFSFIETEKRNSIPFFDKEKDEISFYQFGIGRNDRQEIKDNINLIQDSVLKTFVDRFIFFQPLKWTDFKTHSGNIDNFFVSLWNLGSERKDRTLSNIVYPVCFEKLDITGFAEEYIFILISDFKHGQTFGNKMDYRTLEEILNYNKEYNKLITDSIEFLQSKFYRIDYFDFEFPNPNDPSTPLGVFSQKIKPMAGFLDPDNISIKIDSDIKLEQLEYQGSVFRFPEVIINFLHNNNLIVDRVFLKVSDTETGRDYLYKTIGVNRRGKLELLKGNFQIDTMKMNYIFPPALHDLGRIANSFDLPASLRIEFLFNTKYFFNKEKSLNLTFAAKRNVSLEQVLFRKQPTSTMEILILILIALILIASAIFWGMPVGITTENLGEVSDTFENTDYINNNGKTNTPYLPWQMKEHKMNIVGKVHYRNTKFPFNWKNLGGFPLYIELSDFVCPEGFEVYIQDAEEFIYQKDGNPLKIFHNSKQVTFEFDIVLRQKDEDLIVDHPLKVSFEYVVWFRTAKLFIPQRKSEDIPYTFHIGPELGDVWIAIDPGTTGTCVASGTNLQNIFVELDKEGNDKITPSLIAFDTREDFDPDSDFHQYYKCGDAAETISDLTHIKAFRSIKKMLGYQLEKKVVFNNEKTISLDGKKLTSILVEDVITDHLSFLNLNKNLFPHLVDKTGELKLPERAVITIPNNFTATKTQSLLDSIRDLNRFKEIRYIYEAEAILLYYLQKFKNKNKGDKNEKEKVLLDNTILVFDMGGTTINTTLVHVKENEEGEGTNYKIEILGKLGYALGGDNLDYFILKFLFGIDSIKNSYLGSINPLGPNKDPKSIEKFSKLLLTIKKQFVGYFNDDKQGELIPVQILERLLNSLVPAREKKLNITEVNDFADYLSKSPKNSKSLLKLKELQKEIYNNIRNITTEILQLAGNNIDSVIFAGRSTLFPLIKDTVVNTISNKEIEPTFYQFKGAELKSAVARGACIYGVARTAIELKNLNVNGTFGIKKTRNFDDVAFIELIRMGTPFSENSGIRHTENIVAHKNDTFSMDNLFVEFYQVMGVDADTIFTNNDKQKFDLLTKIKVDTRSKEIGVKVSENDQVICVLEEMNGRKKLEKALVFDRDIKESNEEHYTWIVE